VRVANEKNGHPMKGKRVTFYFDYAYDKESQPPNYLSAEIPESWTYADCACKLLESTQEILEEGYARAMYGKAPPVLHPG
jgi:hypothetical protein